MLEGNFHFHKQINTLCTIETRAHNKKKATYRFDYVEVCNASVLRWFCGTQSRASGAATRSGNFALKF